MLDTRTLGSLSSGGRPAPARPRWRGCWREATDLHFEQISAIFSGVADLKKVFDAARARRETGQGTLLFVDEIHRFNRAQQDSFLPVMEDGTIVLVGATTENPSFELIAPLLSRARVLVFKPLDARRDREAARARRGDRRQAAAARRRGARVARSAWPTATAAPRSRWPRRSGARRAPGETFDAAKLQEVVQRRAPIYDKAQDGHYNLISALHKSVRGSDPDAALYYLCRMLDAGEDPLYIARRVVRMAVEDIGLADPQALVICNAAKDAYDFLGSPEGELAIAQAVIYVATAPKSNAAYTAYGAAMRTAKEAGSLLPPKHILNAPTRLMQSEGYGSRLRLRPRRPRRLFRPGLFPRAARPPDLLRSARARLRARDQEAAGLLGEAEEGTQIARLTAAPYDMVAAMNKHLNDAITRLKTLPEERQREAAELLQDFLQQELSDVFLTPEQLAEIELALGEDEPYASDVEVRATFDRLTK